MAFIIQRALKFLSRIETTALKSLYFHFPPENPAAALVNSPGIYQQERRGTLQDLSQLLKDSILWAVPKKRRSIEKRRCRRFGIPEYVYKPLVPRTNILTCLKCGNYHEAGVLCPTCYNRVKTETQAMQEAIQAKLGISPVESEVVVVYDNDNYDPEFVKGKRIVEMKKERPKIFCDNLLGTSTQGPAKTKEVIEKKEIS